MALNNFINATLPISSTNGGTGVASPTAHGILIAQGASAMTYPVLTNGQLLIGSTGVDPVAASLTAGAGVTITPGAGAITIAATVANNWYIRTNPADPPHPLIAGQGYITVTATFWVYYKLPTSATVGDVYEVAGGDNADWHWGVRQNAGQSIRVGNRTTTVGTDGYFTSISKGDCFRMVCVDGTSGAERFIVVSSANNVSGYDIL